MAEGLLNKCLKVVRKLSASSGPPIWSSSTFTEIPTFPIKPFDRNIIGASTGPQEGLCDIQLESSTAIGPNTVIAGVPDWKSPLVDADGLSFSLYDHKTGAAGGRNGDPNADVFAVVVRPNNALLAVADGCNWGSKPRQAARCAVRGSIEYLNERLFGGNEKCRHTQDVVRLLLLSFDAAQEMIVRSGGTTTTLCVAVVCELAEWKGGYGWGLCVVSVGDSPCFVWQRKTGQVMEVTCAAHQGSERDMRSSGGCLGVSVGNKPDLGNLVCCFTTISEGDVVFLTSDGISDNFDPVTRLEATTQAVASVVTTKRDEDFAKLSVKKLPVLLPEKRHAALLSNMSQLFNSLRLQESKRELSAWEVNNVIMKYVINVTDNKRQYLETSTKDVENPVLDIAERRTRESDFRAKLKTFKGKLDHATIVTYNVAMRGVSRPQHQHVLAEPAGAYGQSSAVSDAVVPPVSHYRSQSSALSSFDIVNSYDM